MKRTLHLFALCLLLQTASNAQNFQATIKQGSVPNSVKAFIRPGTSVSGAQLSSAQLTFMISTSVGNPRPAAVVRQNPLTGMVYVPYKSTETTPDGEFYVYQFDGVGGPTVPAINYAAGTEYELLEVQFNNRPDITAAQVRLAQLPNGGITGDAPGQYNFYLATFTSQNVVNETSQFYGTIASNDGSGYAGYSYAAVNGVVLPVRWLGFSATRQGNDVTLNWDVANEENVADYTLEVSVNGTSFTSLATKAKTNGSGTKKYDYVDKNVGRLNSKVLYYRVKQNDQNGDFSYSPIKSVRLDTKGQIALYPNPAREGFTLNIPYLQADQKRIQLQLVSGAGQVLETKTITRQQAANYYYSLPATIASGDYLLKIFEDGTLTETKQVLVKR